MARLGRAQYIKPHINLPGRIGIYFNIATVSGTVTLSGSGVSGAVVILIRESDKTVVATTTTNGSGAYRFPTTTAISPTETYHVAVEYTDGSNNKYNAKSNWAVAPYVTT